MEAGDRLRILVVDDDEAILVLLADLLAEELGATVATARDGEDAWLLARDERPDLIVLDVMLPTVSGLEISRRIRDDRRTGHIPIVAISASYGRDAVLDAGCSEFLSKPFDLDRLIATIIRLTRPNASQADDQERSA